MKLLILGAGPTGLGAAWRWQELTGTPCVILEADSVPGGLSRSFTDEAGFTWDLGSHLQFSHYDYFDQVLDRAIPTDAWTEHERSTWIWFEGQFIPYPFQLNLHRLPAAHRWTCVEGLFNRIPGSAPPTSFAEWCIETFGNAVTELFMRPYNEKLWSCRLEDMHARWIAERVAVPDIREVLRNLCLETDSTAWGPNARFRYPIKGGTGFIWKSVAASLEPQSILYGRQVVTVNASRRLAVTATGEQFEYDALLSTVPLPCLARMLRGIDGLQAVTGLRAAETHIVGIGLKGQPPESLRNQCWSYFPQPEIPFYRMTVLSNLSAACVPDARATWSLMLEIGGSTAANENKDQIAQRAVNALVARKLAARENVLNIWHRRLPFGYPVPTIDRDSLLQMIHEILEPMNIFSRGRFGAWKYEVSNQDHSFMQGVELVDRLVSGREEVTVNHPDRVNSGRRLLLQACSPNR